MSAATTIEPARRKNLRTIVLLACLLVSVALAWLLVRNRTSVVRTGAELVGELSPAQLGEHWPEAQLAWHLAFSQSQSAGWSAEAVNPLPDGSYEGLSVVYRTANVREPEVQWERWTLSADAKRCSYRAGTLSGRRFRSAPIDTVIELADGRVDVRQIIEGRQVASRAQVPPNYAPEGTLDVLQAMVAGRETEATFSLILNVMPPVGGRPRFFPLYVRHVGTVERNGRPLTLIETEMQSMTSEVLLDAEGHVVEIRLGDLSYRRASREQVLQASPDAERVLAMLAQLTGFTGEADLEPPVDMPSGDANDIPSRPTALRPGP